MTRKRSIVNDQSNLSYRVGNKIVYNTEVLKSNLCYCNDVSILVIGDITNYSHALPTQAAFRNCAPFIKCITKIDGTIIDDAGDLESQCIVC